MVESRLRWVDHMRRPLQAPIRRIDQEEDSTIGRGKPRKITGETIKRDFDLNGLSDDIVYDNEVV